MTLILVSYNIRFGGRGRVGSIADVLRELTPDIAFLQEATDVSVVRSIGERLGMPYAVSQSGRSVAVLSRIPIDTRWHMGPMGVAALEVRAEGLRLFGVHLSAGLSMRGERRRLSEIRHLLQIVQTGRNHAPAAIVGDFNAIAPGDAARIGRLPLWIRALLRFDGGIRTEAMTELRETGLRDAFRTMNPDADGQTMPSILPSVRLDYMLLEERLVQRLLACRVGATSVGATRASDHLPLIAEFETAP